MWKCYLKLFLSILECKEDCLGDLGISRKIMFTCTQGDQMRMPVGKGKTCILFFAAWHSHVYVLVERIYVETERNKQGRGKECVPLHIEMVGRKVR